MTGSLLPVLLIMMSTCIVVHSTTPLPRNSVDPQTVYRSQANGGHSEITRTKRFLFALYPRICCPSIVSKKAFNGTIAQLILINGAMPVGISPIGGVRYYVKLGFYKDAVSDFNSVGPTNVHSFELPGGVESVSGNVGNLIMTVMSIGETGKPTMELSKGSKTFKTITYTGNSYLYK